MDSDSSGGLVWSIEKLYKDNNKLWVADPYAELNLDPNGVLSVYGSDSTHQLGNYNQIWTASNMQWDKIDNGTYISDGGL